MTTRRRMAALLVAVATSAGLSLIGASAGSATPLATGSSSASSSASAVSSAGSWTAGGLIGGEPAALPAQRLAVGAPGPGSGSSAFTRVGACTFYATSASAGGYCAAGHGGSNPPSLRAWLAGRPFVPCRYFDVPTGMEINGGTAPGGRWMIKACFENVDPSQPWGGRQIIIDILANWVHNDEDISIPGYMEEFWDHAAHTNFYPVPRISIGPTLPALVGTYAYFWTTWVKAQDSGQVVKPNYRIAYNTVTEGTVYLHMKIDDVLIYPGVPGMDPVHCGVAKQPFETGAPDAIPQSEGGSQPSECWLMYSHSTATQDNSTVRIHADPYWHVTIETADGRVLRDLGRFHYSAYQRLGVAEVQTLVDW